MKGMNYYSSTYIYKPPTLKDLENYILALFIARAKAINSPTIMRSTHSGRRITFTKNFYA